jgi:hypothetical protein
MGDYGPDDSYHYPTELLALLQKCVPLLCPAKRDVFQFFRAAGVDRDLYADWESQWRENPGSVGKYPVVRDVLNKLNERKTDAALRQRREIIKRVTVWENFSTLWEKDRLPAKGLVVEIQQTVQNALCQALSYRVHVGTQLHEIIYALEKEADLTQMLRGKIQAAIIDKNPFHFFTFT